MLIPQSSGVGIPVDALGSLGDRYFDTAAGRWYLKRWVGYFNGFDQALPQTEPDLTSELFVAATFKTAESFARGYIDILGREMSFKVRTDMDGVLQLLLGNGSSWGSINGNVVSTIAALSTSTWYRLSIDAKSHPGSVIATVNGEIAFDAPFSLTIGGSAVNKFRIGGVTDSPWSRPICNVLYCGSRWDIDDGSGYTLRDSSGRRNDCVVSDEAPTGFWLQTWVPMDLL